jgi:hypothetical protein
VAHFDLLSWHIDVGTEENKNVSLISVDLGVLRK